MREPNVIRHRYVVSSFLELKHLNKNVFLFATSSSFRQHDADDFLEDFLLETSKGGDLLQLQISC